MRFTSWPPSPSPPARSLRHRGGAFARRRECRPSLPLEWCGEQLEIFHPHLPRALNGHVQFDQVGLLPLLQIKRRLIRSPVRSAADGVMNPFREELAAARKMTPHLQKGAPGECLGLDLRSIREEALLDLRVFHLEEPNDAISPGVDQPDILCDSDLIASQCRVADAELANHPGRT